MRTKTMLTLSVAAFAMLAAGSAEARRARREVVVHSPAAITHRVTTHQRGVTVGVSRHVAPGRQVYVTPRRQVHVARYQDTHRDYAARHVVVRPAANARWIHRAGRRAYLYDGRYWVHDGPGYAIARPTRGVVVPWLPAHHTVSWVGGRAHYSCDGVHYVAVPGGYRVMGWDTY